MPCDTGVIMTTTLPLLKVEKIILQIFDRNLLRRILPVECMLSSFSPRHLRDIIVLKATSYVVIVQLHPPLEREMPSPRIFLSTTFRMQASRNIFGVFLVCAHLRGFGVLVVLEFKRVVI